MYWVNDKRCHKAVFSEQLLMHGNINAPKRAFN
jgi:hypothetical protein